jgi:hypothetical protein
MSKIPEGLSKRVDERVDLIVLPVDPFIHLLIHPFTLLPIYNNLIDNSGAIH